MPRMTMAEEVASRLPRRRLGASLPMHRYASQEVPLGPDPPQEEAQDYWHMVYILLYAVAARADVLALDGDDGRRQRELGGRPWVHPPNSMSQALFPSVVSQDLMATQAFVQPCFRC